MRATADANPNEMKQSRMADLNNKLKSKTRKCYSKIKSSLDPKGHIVDTLFEEEVITAKQCKEMNGGPDQETRAEHLLSHLFETSHPQAFVVFIEALKKDYGWIVQIIHGKGMTIC